MKKISIAITFLALSLVCSSQTKYIFGMGFSPTEGIGNSYSFGWGSNFKLQKNLTFTAGLIVTGTSVSDYRWTDSNTNTFTWGPTTLINIPVIVSLQYNYPVLQFENHKQLGIFIEPMLLYQPYDLGFIGSHGDLTINDMQSSGSLNNQLTNVFNWEVNLGVAYKYNRTDELQFSFYYSSLDVYQPYRDMSFNGVKFGSNLPKAGIAGIKLIFANEKL